MRGFIDFIREKGVIGLAIGFLMGGAVTKLVTAFVEDLVNPLVGLLLGRVGSLRDLTLILGSVSIKWGDFLAALVDFVIVAAVIYFAFRGLKPERLDRKPGPPT